jgi:hypothetical protein
MEAFFDFMQTWGIFIAIVLILMFGIVDAEMKREHSSSASGCTSESGSFGDDSSNGGDGGCSGGGCGGGGCGGGGCGGGGD